MRLITRKIWRAFPELDRFGDEQCKRFVRAASYGLVARGVRWGVVALAALVGTALIPGVALLERLCIDWGWWREPVMEKALGQPRWMNEVVYIVLLLGTVFALGALLGALTRDVLLRRRVRRVLSTRGRCAHCTYFLGGLPVSTRLQVVCPECGFQTEVDASLGELADGADGVARFAPSEELIRASEPWLTRRRLWKWTKRAAAVLAVVLIVAGAGWGWHEWRLSKQAQRAAALKPGADVLVDMMERLQLKGKGADAAGANGFDLLAPLMAKMAKVQADLYPDGLPEGKDGMYLYIGGEWVAQRPEARDTAHTIKERELNEPYSLNVMREYEKQGVFDDMRAMVEAPLAIGIGRLPKEQPLVGIMLADYAKMRQLARWNGGRMRLAVREDDPFKFVDAYSATYGMCRMLENQPVLIARLVAIAMRALADGEMRDAIRQRHDVRWLDAYEAALKRHERHEPMSIAYEGERVFSKDLACWVFSDPARARLGKYSPALRTALGALSGSTRVPDGRLGTLEENLDAVDAFYDEFIAESDLPRWKRKHVPSPTGGLLLVEELLPSLDKSLRSNDQVEVDRVSMPILVALERYRLEKGAYPATLAELSPRWLPVAPVDPICGKPFCYRLIGDSGDDQGRGFLLYSMGSDGVDDGGVRAAQPWDAIHKVGVTGIDYIINDVNR